MAGKHGDNSTREELQGEIEQLRLRLDEAEQTLDAIRSGEVDALIIAGPHGDQVFSLTGAERTYRLIVETMNEAALTVGLDETILFCNQRFCDLMKTPMAETIGQKLTAFVAPAQHQSLRLLLADALAGPVQWRFTLRATDGVAVSVQIAASLLVADAFTSICLVVSDLTKLEAQASSIRVLREQQQALEESRAELLGEVAERKRMEEELQRSKEVAESATQAKSQFLANMSHELRTPMTGVLGMLDLVLAGNLEAEQREFIEIAHTSALALVRILNDILDLTKIEMGKFSMEHKPFGIRKCLEDTFNILLPVAKSKGLILDFSVADTVPETVAGDQTRLSQVLTNLVDNAVKFTRKGTVTIGVAAESAVAGRREITFTVADTGIGIPDDKKELLFRAFSQVDESHARIYGGTGLGLVISQEIAERMGGAIVFTSEEGVGSTFSCRIPFGEVEAAPDAIIAAAQTAPAGDVPCSAAVMKARLLIAEDDPTIRRVLGPMLRRSNYEIDIAENGEQTVEKWENGGFDLILMDVQMPGMNGFETTALIREKERTRGGHIPIIAMTAHALKEDKDRCLDSGMDGYISKPIDFKKSLQVIGDILKLKM